MGRPLKKKFFQSGTGATGFQVGCNAWFTGEGAAESSYIISQRSNSKYLVGSDVGGATPTRTEVLKLVDGAPAAAGEMQVEVQPENAQPIATATVTIVGGGGAMTSVVVADGGYGYWTNETAIALIGGPDGTIDYQVANGSIVAVQIAAAGAANADGTYDVAATGQLADPPLQSARIINAKTVKTFGPTATQGETYLWPIVGADDGAGPSGRTEADLQAAT